jgi:hypothetical protein
MNAPTGILIKGHSVVIFFDDDTKKVLPEKFGIIHDPDGTEFRPSDVFFASYRMTNTPAEMTKKARKYFGDDYDGVKAKFDIPDTGWHLVKSGVVRIDYVRTGDKHPGPFWHPFYKNWIWKKEPLALYQSGRVYLLRLPKDAVIDERGFVFP